MPVLFTCPHCGAQTEVDDRYTGQSGPCYSCGKEVTVPSAAEAAMAAIVSQSVRPSAVRIGLILLVILAGLTAVGVLIGLGTKLLWPALSGIGESAGRLDCRNHLKQIALAMEAYHDDHGCYPPAYTADADGKPMHSWRVLLLPYLDEQQWLYERYDFNQPWDSPQNLMLGRYMPEAYGCPSDENSLNSVGETSYMVVTGPRTLFPGAGSSRRGQIRDGTANTIFVVEVIGHGRSWLEPADLDVRNLQLQVNGRKGQEISSRHPGGANVLMVDGSVHFMPDETPPEIIEALITPNGGEAITPAALVE